MSDVTTLVAKPSHYIITEVYSQVVARKLVPSQVVPNLVKSYINLVKLYIMSSTRTLCSQL